MILDRDFLKRVATDREQFAKDDLLRVRLRHVQRFSTSQGLKVDYEVLRVLEHRIASPKMQRHLASAEGTGAPPSP